MSNKYFSDELILPGETILEMMEEYGMTQKELSNRLGYSTKHVNRVIKGKSEITVDFAMKLELIFGLETSFWLNLESNYRIQLAKKEELKALEEEKNIAKDIPYAEMAKLGWVDKTRKINEKIKNLRSFFRVSKLTLIGDVYSYAFREKGGEKSSNLAQAAWIAKGERMASKLEVAKFDVDKLMTTVEKIRSLTLNEDPEFIEELTEICASCGIKFVLVPRLPKTFVHGVTKWIDKDTALIMLSLRYKYGDILWFSFFHEIAHLVIHGKRIVNKQINDNEIESEADDFASKLLVPEKEYQEFIRANNFTSHAIKMFSSKINIHPGIIVGRLMHDKYIAYNNSARNLRVKYDWK